MGRGGCNKGQGWQGKGNVGAQSVGNGKAEGKPDVLNTSALAVIPPSSLTKDSSFDFESTKESVTRLSNYVWDATAQSRRPTIRIQTLPNAYQSDQGPMKLVADQAPLIVDENLTHLPDDPTAPIYRAVQAVHPDFDFRGVDVVLDSNTIRKLWGFVRGDCYATATVTEDGCRDPSFMLKVDTFGVGGPLIFTRVEPRVRIPALPNNFGPAFAKAVAAPVNEPHGEMFYSITTACLGQIKLLVRSEVDAGDYASEAPSDFAVSNLGIGEGFFGASSFDCVLQGAHFDGTFVEVKTKRAKYVGEVDWDAILMQMLFSDTGKLVLGLQEKGWFCEPSEFSFHQVLDKANKRSIDMDLARLAMLFRRIADVVERSGGSLDICCGGKPGHNLVMKSRA